MSECPKVLEKEVTAALVYAGLSYAIHRVKEPG